MKESDLTNEELMREIKSDNMKAFDELYEKYSKRIYQFSYSILKSHEEAENLMQDVFLTIWENRHKVQKDSSIKSYIFTVTYHSAISIIRKKAKDARFVEYLKSIQDISQGGINIEVEYNELSNKLDDVLQSLPERQKEVYVLHKFEGMKYKEISKKLNISVNTIENHMSRALKTIRKELGDYSPVGILFMFLFV